MSFKVFSEWLGNEKDNPPPSLYFTEAKLQVWLRLTEFLEDTLKTVRKQLRPHLYDLQKKMTGKIIGIVLLFTFKITLNTEPLYNVSEM